jgi:hypothetical protein
MGSATVLVRSAAASLLLVFRRRLRSVSAARGGIADADFDGLVTAALAGERTA